MLNEVIVTCYEQLFRPSCRVRAPFLRQAVQHLPRAIQKCPAAMRYHGLLVSIGWDRFPERDLLGKYPQTPISYTSFAAACLVKINQHFSYMSQLHEYLSEHRQLARLLGFAEPLPTVRHLN